MNIQRKIVLIFLANFFISISMMSFGLSTDKDSYELSEKYLKKLKPEAVEYYNKAIEALDHINYDFALEYFEKAALINPENIELQFTYAKLATRRARIKIGEESIKLYNKSISAFDEIIKNPRATTNQLERAKNQKELIDKELQEVAVRDERRKTVGLKIIQDKLEAEKKLQEAEEKAQKDAEALRQQALTKTKTTKTTQASSGGGRGGGGGRR